MPNPIPVVVLARLAVCRSVQGQGIARALLADVFERVLWASDHIGVRGILVHAASPAARSFYLRMGFDPSPMDPNTLMLRLSDVEAAMKPQDSQSGNSAAER
jgi:GNAT superfamily N-acetyltransferase